MANDNREAQVRPARTRHAHPWWQRAGLTALGCIALAGAAGTAGCSAEGQPGPYVPPSVGKSAHCRDLPSATTALREAIDNGTFDEAGPVLDEVLFERGQQRVLMPALGVLSSAVKPAELLPIVEAWPEGRGMARLMPHLEETLSYIAGRNGYAGNEAPVLALHDLLEGCEPDVLLGFLHEGMRVTVPHPDGGTAPLLVALLDVAAEIANDPEIAAILGSIQFSEDGGQGVVVGRDAFQLLMGLVLESTAAPGFDVGEVRRLIEDTVVPALPADTGADVRLQRLLDVLEAGASADSAFVEKMSASASCMVRLDREQAVAGMLFDYFSIDDLSVSTLISDLQAMAADEERALFFDQSEAILGALRQNLRVAKDLNGAMAVFLEPSYGRVLAGVVLDLAQTEVVPEAISLLADLLKDCQRPGGAS